MNLSVLVVTFVVSYLIPAATSLFTRVNASVWLKQFVTAFLSAVNGVLVSGTVANGTAFLSKTALVLALGSFLAAQAAYTGFYKPHNANAVIAPKVGIG